MNKKQRATLHVQINGLSPEEVAAIVKQQHPRAKGARADQLAKQLIAGAHRQVSPRTLPKMQRG
jgi:hypothetical protein